MFCPQVSTPNKCTLHLKKKKKKSPQPLSEQQQDKVHSRDVYHIARGVTRCLVIIWGKDTLASHFS